MPRIKIIKSPDSIIALQVNGVPTAPIPFDDDFHAVDAELLPLLDDCDVLYEIENVEAREAAASTGGAVGLGGSAAPPPNPFDHDGDGKPGGSRKGRKLGQRIKAALTKKKKKAKS